MSRLISKFVSNLPSISSQQNGAIMGMSTVFSIRKSKANPEIATIHLASYPTNAAPLYSVRISKHAKPQVVIFRGYDSNSTIGSTRLHSMSLKVDLVVHGEPIMMKYSDTSGSCTVHHPTLGNFKWKASQLSGSSWELVGSAGTRLARLKSGSMLGLGEEKLELLVTCQDAFLDLVVVSAME
jgi:hypothetical protein